MNQKYFIKSIARAMLALSFTGLILLAGCKTQEIKTHWSAEPVKVDGEMTEWAGMPTTYFEDSGVQLGLSNDNQNLYILFHFSNQAWARAIRMGGVTLWLDNSGKKKKDFGIRYAGGAPLSEIQKLGMAGEGGFIDKLTPEQKERLMEKQASMANQVTVIYKEKDQGIALPANGSRGPAVAFADTQNIYTYEFSIPLQKGNVFDCAIGAQPGQTICLGLEWGGISKEDHQRLMQERSSGGRSGMGGGHGGRGGKGGGRGHGGGRGGSKGGSGMQPPEKEEIWVKTVLASPTKEKGEK